MSEFCFTIYHEEPMEWDPAEMNYLVYQREICPTTGTPHWQTYAEFHSKKRFDTMKNYLRAHDMGDVRFVPTKGTAEQNKVYCSKSKSAVEGTFKEFGIARPPKCQGKRTDIIRIMDMIDQPIENILRAIPASMKYIGHMEKAKGYLEKKTPTIRPIKVHYIHGKPGCGKSRAIATHLMEADYYTPLIQNNQIWFDGYSGEKIIWLDDVDLLKYDREFVLKLLDRYKLKLPIKGGSTYAKYEEVFLSSNRPPPKDHEYFRRLTHIYDCDLGIPMFTVFAEPHPDYEQAELDYLSSLGVQ